MGTLWALRNLFSKIESDVLLRNGDTVCDVNLGKFIKYSHSKGKLATIVVVRMRSPFGMVSVEGNTVKKFDEKPLLPYYVNRGTYFLREETESILKRNFADRSIEGSLFKSLASKGEIAAYKYGGFWKPVDTVKDYEEIKKIIIERKL